MIHRVSLHAGNGTGSYGTGPTEGEARALAVHYWHCDVQRLVSTATEVSETIADDGAVTELYRGPYRRKRIR